MKKITLLLIALVASLGLFAQDMQNLAYFSFNSLSQNVAVPTVIASDEGMISTAALYMDGTNGSSEWPSGALGNFSGNSTNALPGYASGRDLALQSNASNQKSIVFKLSTTGFQGLMLTYAFKRTALGHTTCTWSYSTDGLSFTNLPVPADQPYAGVAIDYRLETVDMSGITALNDQSEVYLKLYVDGCDGDNSRIRLDNVLFSAYPGGPDVYPPHITNVVLADSNMVVVTFNEDLDSATAETVTNYTFDNGSATATATHFGNVVNLLVAPAFANGVSFNMFVQNVTDVAGNLMAPDTFELMYGIPAEFMCADIATLRSKFSCEDYSVNVRDSIEYKITGTMVVTAVAEYKNQKVLQDASGAILVFDEGNVIGGLNVGDKISGVYCKLTNYFGFLELVPTRPYEHFEGMWSEDITPMEITLAQLNDNAFMIEHQAELIVLNDVTITSTGNFAKLNRYDLSQDGVSAPALYPYFQDVNYLTMPIPTGVVQNITGINFATSKIGNSNFDFRYYIVPRSTADMTGMSRVQDYGKMQISVYPNPTTAFVTVNDIEATDAEIYDINGKKVATQSMQHTNMVSMQNLSAGSYFLRLLKDNELVGTAKVIKR